MIQVTGVVADYGAQPVLHGVDLCLEDGQALCIVGPNGSGKSTVLRAIYGLAHVRAGRVMVDGVDVTHLPAGERLRRTRMAYVLQESSIFPDMTVEQNLRLGGHLMAPARAARDAAARLLDEYPTLAALGRQRAGTLSGGERRLLEIVRSLIMDPLILLADEPTIGLAPQAVESVFALFDTLRQRGKSILLVEQNTRAGLGFADLGCVLVAGQVVRTGPAKALLADTAMANMLLGVEA
jgi:branched-chain amino acid transport system ATP-binding protein